MVEHAIFVGSTTELHVRIPGGGLLKAHLPNDGSARDVEQGTPVTLSLPPSALRVLTPAAAPAEPAEPRGRGAGLAPL